MNPPPTQTRLQAATPIDMAFLDLVNLRVDHVKAYNGNKQCMEDPGPWHTLDRVVEGLQVQRDYRKNGRGFRAVSEQGFIACG